MESELSNFGFPAVNSEQDFIDFLVSYFDWLENFDVDLKILSFYHVERYKHDDCSQCLFTVNLRYLYVEHCLQTKTDVKELINYCKMRKEQFITSHLFTPRLADLERKRLELEKEFIEILSLWNNGKEELPAPLPNLNPGQGSVWANFLKK